MEKKILSNINRIVSILIELNYTGNTGKESYYNEAVYLIREIKPLLMRLADGKENLLDSLIRQLILQKLPHPSMQSGSGGLQEDLNVIISRALATEILFADADCGDDTENTELPAASPVETHITTDPAAEFSDEAELCSEAPPETITAVEQPEAVPPPDETSLADDSFTEATVSEEIAISDSLQENIVFENLEENIVPDNLQEKTASDNLQGIIDIIYANETIIKGFLYRSMFFDYYLPDKKLAIVKIKQLQRRHRMHDILLKKDGISLVEIASDDIRDKAKLYNKLRRLS